MPKTFPNAPYFDNSAQEIQNDYVAELFNPSRALQARELTQLQQLLQWQIENVGDFLFQDGSPVTGAHITFDNSVLSLQIQANDNVNLSDFVGKLIINPNGAVNTQAVVVAVDTSISSNVIEGALIVKYLSANEFPDGSTVQIATGTQETCQLIPANATSQASIASINPGVVYSNGYFVTVTQQTIVLDSLNPNPSLYIGLEIDQGVIDYTADASLLDPALGSSNYQAPGADRFQYQLNLSKRLLNSVDLSQFISLVTVQNGVIINEIDYPELGQIQSALAQRTYDTNGNFVINPFILSVTGDVTNTNNLVLQVSAGKAYVEGYEFETATTVKISESKALTTNQSTDYPLAMDYGNYLNITNLYGGNISSVTTNTFGSFDVHIVPSGNINTATAAAYSNTKMGTLRIRDIEYTSSNPNVWSAYVLDVNLPPITANANAVSANQTMVYLPQAFTASPNAIINVTFTVIAGNSNGDVRTITSYVPSTKIGYLNAPTSQLLDTTSKLAIQFAVKDINSVVATPTTFGGNVFYTQNASSGDYMCMDISTTAGKDLNGNTVLISQGYNKMVFPLPQDFIAQNTFSNVTFYNRKTLQNVSFTGGNATIGTGTGLDPNEIYTFGFTNQYLPDAIAKNNFLVIVRNASTSNLANGQVITFDINQNPGGNGVYQTDTTHVTVHSSTSGNFVGDVLLTVEDQNASVNFRRSKTLTGNVSNTTLRTTDSYLNGTAVIGSPNNATYIDTANGFIWFTSYPDTNLVPGFVQSLYAPDVFSILKIYDSGSPSFQPNTNNAIDITARYNLNTGQKDNYYDHASITLRPGSQPPQGQTAIMALMYIHDSTTGFFSADSYSASAYANNFIPVYNSAIYGAINLRDSIDFRPTRTIGTTSNVQTFTLSGLRLPEPVDPMFLTYSYYLPRTDKLVLTSDRQFDLLTGVPSLTPQPPPDVANTMTLYTIAIEPFTYTANNVATTYVENRVYTMADIGVLDSRISVLEQYSSLTALQAAAANTTVLYQNGLIAKDVFGILTDDFTDYSLADVNNIDLNCFIFNGVLMPGQQATPITLKYVGATGFYAINDQTVSLGSNGNIMLCQNTCSDFVQIQPYAFGQFTGFVTMRPTVDTWFSSNLYPTITAPVVTPPPPPPPPTIPPNSPVGITGGSGVNRGGLSYVGSTGSGSSVWVYTSPGAANWAGSSYSVPGSLASRFADGPAKTYYLSIGPGPGGVHFN